MTGRYVPQVGDRVRLDIWHPDEWMDVTLVGRKVIEGDSWAGNVVVEFIDHGWVKVERPTPLPERWISLRGDDLAFVYNDNHLSRSCERIAVIHIWTDADGNDHADIERVTS